MTIGQLCIIPPLNMFFGQSYTLIAEISNDISNLFVTEGHSTSYLLFTLIAGSSRFTVVFGSLKLLHL